MFIYYRPDESTPGSYTLVGIDCRKGNAYGRRTSSPSGSRGSTNKLLCRFLHIVAWPIDKPKSATSWVFIPDYLTGKVTTQLHATADLFTAMMPGVAIDGNITAQSPIYAFNMGTPLFNSYFKADDGQFTLDISSRGVRIYQNNAWVSFGYNIGGNNLAHEIMSWVPAKKGSPVGPYIMAIDGLQCQSVGGNPDFKETWKIDHDIEGLTAATKGSAPIYVYHSTGAFDQQFTVEPYEPKSIGPNAVTGPCGDIVYLDDEAIKGFKAKLSDYLIEGDAAMSKVPFVVR